jgi:branched-chain amino acid transport system substrate-binding protein
MIHDMYLFQVKAPEESKAPWDYYKHLSTIKGDQAFATLQESGCQVTQ